MSDWKNREEETPVVRPTEIEGTYAAPLSLGELDDYLNMVISEEHIALPLTEQVMKQAAIIMRAEDGRPFDNLADAEFMKKVDPNVIRKDLRACLASLMGKGDFPESNE